MEIKIGVRHNTREIVIETSEAQEILTEKVTKAIENGSILEVMDEKGNTMWFRFPSYSPPCASALEDASLTFQF